MGHCSGAVQLPVLLTPNIPSCSAVSVSHSDVWKRPVSGCIKFVLALACWLESLNLAFPIFLDHKFNLGFVKVALHCEIVVIRPFLKLFVAGDVTIHSTETLYKTQNVILSTLFNGSSTFDKNKFEVKLWVKFRDTLCHFDSFHMTLKLWNNPLDGRKHSLCIIKLAIIKFTAIDCNLHVQLFLFSFLK